MYIYIYIYIHIHIDIHIYIYIYIYIYELLGGSNAGAVFRRILMKESLKKLEAPSCRSCTGFTISFPYLIQSSSGLVCLNVVLLVAVRYEHERLAS